MTAKASTYGFTVNPDQHWSHAAGCAGENPDMWFSGSSSSPKWILVAEAMHICKRHCPVRQRCKQDIGVLPGGVVAGVFYNERGRVSDYQPELHSCRRCGDG